MIEHIYATGRMCGNSNYNPLFDVHGYPCFHPVTTDQPAQVFVHKVKKVDKDAFKKRQSWSLAELKVVDGKDSKIVSPQK